MKKQDSAVKEPSICFLLLSRLLPLKLLLELFSTSLLLLMGVISGTRQLTSPSLNCSRVNVTGALRKCKVSCWQHFLAGHLVLTHVSFPFVGPAPVTSQSPVPCKLCIFSEGLGRAGEASCHLSLHWGLRVVQAPKSGVNHTMESTCGVSLSSRAGPPWGPQ